MRVGSWWFWPFFVLTLHDDAFFTVTWVRMWKEGSAGEHDFAGFVAVAKGWFVLLLFSGSGWESSWEKVHETAARAQFGRTCANHYKYQTTFQNLKGEVGKSAYNSSESSILWVWCTIWCHPCFAELHPELRKKQWNCHVGMQLVVAECGGGAERREEWLHRRDSLEK